MKILLNLTYELLKYIEAVLVWTYTTQPSLSMGSGVYFPSFPLPLKFKTSYMITYCKAITIQWINLWRNSRRITRGMCWSIQSNLTDLTAFIRMSMARLESYSMNARAKSCLDIAIPGHNSCVVSEIISLQTDHILNFFVDQNYNITTG